MTFDERGVLHRVVLRFRVSREREVRAWGEQRAVPGFRRESSGLRVISERA